MLMWDTVKYGGEECGMRVGGWEQRKRGEGGSWNNSKQRDGREKKPPGVKILV